MRLRNCEPFELQTLYVQAHGGGHFADHFDAGSDGGPREAGTPVDAAIDLPDSSAGAGGMSAVEDSSAPSPAGAAGDAGLPPKDGGYGGLPPNFLFPDGGFNPNALGKGCDCSLPGGSSSGRLEFLLSLGLMGLFVVRRRTA